MKKIITFFVFCCCAVSCCAITITKTRTANGTEKHDYLHKAANDFSNEVGNALKKNFPARVSAVGVGLTLEKGQIKITYTAIILPCAKNVAQSYFEHRGALSVKKDKQQSHTDAVLRCGNQKMSAEHIFSISYGGVLSAHSGSSVQFKGNWWCVEEDFFMNN